VTAYTTENSAFIEFTFRPNDRLMIGNRRVTFETRIPAATAFEVDSDDVEIAVPVCAAGFRIYIYAGHNGLHNCSVDMSSDTAGKDT
jgi:hypothetical protein